ncbi:MAG: hypothetical protein GY906_36930 [bacterium]|nr:hypothetical protein [bacterium]
MSDDIRRFADLSPTTTSVIPFIEDLQDRLSSFCSSIISFNNPSERPRAGDLDRAIGSTLSEFIGDSHDAGPDLDPDDKDWRPDSDNFVGLGGGPFIPGPQPEPSPDRDDSLVDYPIRDPDESLRALSLHRADRGGIILTVLGFRRIHGPPPGPIDDISPEDWLTILKVLQLVQGE